MKKCPYCAEDIQDEALKCKHCGEWLEREKTSRDGSKTTIKPQLKAAGNIQSIHNKRKPWIAFSWKTLFFSIFIAIILNIIIAAAIDSEPRKNIVWTVLWIYLTIEAWKYWGWKSLIPYPAYAVCTFILTYILISFGVEGMPLIFIPAATNIGGLIIFYMILNKSSDRILYNSSQQFDKVQPQKMSSTSAIKDIKTWFSTHNNGIALLFFAIVVLIGVLSRYFTQIDHIPTPKVNAPVATKDDGWLDDFPEEDSTIQLDPIPNGDDTLDKIEPFPVDVPDWTEKATEDNYNLIKQKYIHKGFLEHNNGILSNNFEINKRKTGSTIDIVNLNSRPKIIYLSLIGEDDNFVTCLSVDMEIAPLSSMKMAFACPSGVHFDKLKRIIRYELKTKQQLDGQKPGETERNKTTAIDWFNRGLNYSYSGQYNEAIEAYKQAIKINPDYADAHYNLGVIYGKSGKYNEGIEPFRQVIRIKPDLEKAHVGLGFAYSMSGNYKHGIQAFKQAIRINPNNVDAHFTLGVSYLRLDDRDSALEEYRILKDLNSQKANELFNLIEAH